MGKQHKLHPFNGHFEVQMDLMNGQASKKKHLLNGQAVENAPVECANSRKCYKNMYVVQVDLLNE